MDKSQESIQHLAERVQTIWRKTRPRLMRLYERTEQVKARSLEAARHLRMTTENLQQMGLAFDQASNLAMYEWVRLPDIDARDELELGRVAANSSQ